MYEPVMHKSRGRALSWTGAGGAYWQARTACGMTVGEGYAHRQWKYVTCKNCRKKRPEKKRGS